MSNLDNQTPLGTEVLKISDDTNQTSKMCSNILPTIIDILTVHDLDPQVIKQQKNIIDSLDAYTFFAGDRGNEYDNGGAHIWFINNFQGLIEAKKKGNEDAKYILNKIQEIVKANLGKLAEGIEEDLNLSPIKEDLSKSFNEFEGIFLHGFRCDLLEFKGVQCWSTRGYFDK